MNGLIQSLQGCKTYLICVVGLVLLFGSWQHWWVIATEFYEALLAAALVFLRMGVARAAGAANPNGGGSGVGAPASTSSKGFVSLPLLFGILALGLVAL